MARRFTDVQIKALRARAQRYEQFEDGTGFGVRVSTVGLKTWILMYRYQGKARRLTIGTYPDMGLAAARTAAAEAREKLILGFDPGAEAVAEKARRSSAATIDTLIDDYMRLYVRVRKRASSAKEEERLLLTKVLPEWKGRKARDIRRADVVLLLDGIVERGAPISANRTKSVLSKMFNWGIERDYVEMNPAAHLGRPVDEKSRDRNLSPAEIRTFWTGLDAAADISLVFRLALRFKLVTGQRRGEIAQARWDQFDPDLTLWTIPAEVTKNNMIHLVPITATARALLHEAREALVFRDKDGVERRSEWVFPARRGKGANHITGSGISQAVAALLPTDKEKADGTGLELAHFTPHDLRRTFATRAIEAGVRRDWIKLCLNHTTADVTAIYDRYGYMAEKRMAMEAWEKRLLDIVNGAAPASNVIRLDVIA